jgi:hypothetical protein
MRRYCIIRQLVTVSTEVQGAALALGLALAASSGAPVWAQAFTSRADFTAALPAPGSTSGFDAAAAGTTVPSGGTLGGIAFTYSIGAELLKATAAYPATSPANSLGSTDADIFQDGDNLTLGFSGRNAIGLSIITREVLEAGDLSLTAGGVTASLAPSVQQTLSDGANVYFLGVIRPTTTFTSATLTTVGGGYFLFNLDDITTATSPDADGDGIADLADNCKLAANPAQCDSDGDGFGNYCDGDLNNNGFTNAQDTTLFRLQLGLPSAPPTYNAADLNCNGFVNAQDTVRLRQLLGNPPGP